MIEQPENNGPSEPNNAHALERNATAGSWSRRRFLAGGAATLGLGGLAPLLVPRHVLGGEGYQAPSDTLTIAAIGVGGMGQNYLAGCKGERIVALCDLDHHRCAGVFQTYPNATRYHDFRQMFDREAKNFDALVIATPDHTHAFLLLAGLRLGKHLYCAKPITHSIAEARKVRTAVLAAKVATQSSVQSAGCESSCRTAELLRSGVLGPVRELHIWCDHPAYPCALLRPKDTPAPPPGLDWDLWLGPAPFRPYHPAYHPANWRPWWDFGSGTVGDMGCHTFHAYFDELQLGAPSAVSACASTRHEGFFRPVETPECQSHANLVTWEFPARGELPPLTVHWYDGGMRPARPAELDHRLNLPRAGLLFVGDQGKLLAGYSGGGAGPGSQPGGLLLPQARFRDFPPPPRTLPRTADHYREWTAACKTGSRTACPIPRGAQLTEMALLGALALRSGTGRVLEWDAVSMRVTNDPEANLLVNPPARPGWTLEA